MSTKKNRELLILLLIVFGVAAGLWWLIRGDSTAKKACTEGQVVKAADCECQRPMREVQGVCTMASPSGSGAGGADPGGPMCSPTKPCPNPNDECHDGDCIPKPQCSVANPCPDHDQDCVDGQCRPRDVKKTCADGELITGCVCKGTMKVKDGRCRNVDAAERCQLPVFLEACQRVTLACAGKGLGCEGKAWSDLQIGDQAVNDLLGHFTDQSALLFPNGIPMHGQNAGEIAALREPFKQFVAAHWQPIEDAKMLIILGRASRTGPPAINERLAKQRMTLAADLLIEVCKEKKPGANGEISKVCQELVGKRAKQAAISSNRSIDWSEFGEVFAPPGASGVRVQNWIAPNTQMGGDVTTAMTPNAPIATRTKGTNYMNQAVFFIPIPCECNPNAPAATPARHPTSP